MSKRKILENYLYSSCYQIFLIIVPLITAPYMARVLLPSGIGINSYVSTVIQMFTLFGLLGLNGYSSREIAYVRDDKKKLSKTFYELFVLRVIFCILTTISYIVFAQFNEYQYYFYAQILTIIATFEDLAWFYVGLEEFKVTVTRNFAIKILNVATIFIFVKDPGDLYLYMGLTAFWSFAGNLLLYKGLKKRINKVDRHTLEIKKHLMPTIKLFLPQVASMIYLQVDKLMIKGLTDQVEGVGFYEQAERIVKMPIALITAFSSVMMPRISNVFKNNQLDEVKKYLMNSFQFSLFFAIPMMFGIASISSTMIPWFLGKGYEDVIPIMFALCPIVLFISLSGVTGNQYLTAINNTRALTISYVVAAILNIIVNYFCIIQFGFVGAAFGTIVAEGLVFFIQLYFMKDIITITGLIKKSYKYWISGIIMFVTCMIIGNQLSPTILTTMLQIIVGTIFYFGILFLLRDDFLLRNFNAAKARVLAKLKRS